jgi:methyl-accepting chemotaxis protein
VAAHSASISTHEEEHVISAALFAVQTDPAIAEQLQRLVTTQIVIATSLLVMGIAVIGVAIAALFAIRKQARLVDRSIAQLKPRLDPILISVARIADDATDVSGALKYRVNDLLETVDDLNARLRVGVDSVEKRVRQLGTVVDVVQTEAEEILLDAASTARGVHTASQVLRGGRAALPPDLEDEDVEEEEDDDEYIE